MNSRAIIYVILPLTPFCTRLYSLDLPALPWLGNKMVWI
jgi:hypothetical protein